MIVAHKRERMIRFLVLMVALSLIVALIGIYVYLVYGSFMFAKWENQSYNWNRGGRVYNDWGRAAAYGATILLLLFLRARFASTRQLFFGVLLGICTYFVFIASSRSALLSLAIPAMLFLAVYLVPTGRQGLALSPAPILLGVLLVMIATAVGLAIASGQKVDTVGRFMRLLNQAENTELVMGANRFDYFAAALQLFFQSPLVGHGVRSFSVLYKNYEDAGAYAHNMVLEVLGDTGLVGLFLFFLLFFVALRPITFHRLRTDPLLLCVMMLFVGRLMVAMVGNELSYQQPLFLFLGLLALKKAPQDEAAVEPGEAPAEAPAVAVPGHRPAAAGVR
jgi:O-antigen ligase